MRRALIAVAITLVCAAPASAAELNATVKAAAVAAIEVWRASECMEFLMSEARPR